MTKPPIVNISENNTPIAMNAMPSSKPGGCGGKCGGKCGNKDHSIPFTESAHAEHGAGKVAQAILLAVILIGSAICFFYFS